MQNQIEIFKNEEFGQVRTLLINNEVYFVGKDVAEILGYSNSSKAVSTHVDDEDKIMEMIAHSQNGNVVKTQTALINESGLYSLILSSKLPIAKKFKRWVTLEVLPSIRKTGSYGNNKDLLLQFLTQLPQEQIKLIINQLQHKLLPSKPVKEALYDFLADNLESLSLTIENYVEVNYEIFKNYFQNNGYKIDDVMRELKHKDLVQADTFGFCVKGNKIVIKMKPSLKFYEE